MVHKQSRYSTGVLDWTVKATAPQWQLPSSSTGMMIITRMQVKERC